MTFRSKKNLAMIVIMVFIVLLIISGLFMTIHSLNKQFGEYDEDNTEDVNQLNDDISIDHQSNDIIITVNNFDEIDFIEILKEDDKKILNENNPEVIVGKNEYSQITIREWQEGSIISYKVIEFDSS